MPDEVREHLTRDQRPFLHSRISPDPSDSQLHDGASSLQFTSLVFYRVQVRGLEWPQQKLGFVLSDPFLCCWGLCLDYCTFGRSKHGVFSHSNSPPHRALGRYRHMSSSRQIRNIFCWLEILNYCPDDGNGNFHCSSSFLKATSLICEAQLSFAAHQKYIIWFFSLWWMINLEFGLCFVFPPI